MEFWMRYITILDKKFKIVVCSDLRESWSGRFGKIYGAYH